MSNRDSKCCLEYECCAHAEVGIALMLCSSDGIRLSSCFAFVVCGDIHITIESIGDVIII